MALTLFRLGDGVATITLNRDEKCNAFDDRLSESMMLGISRAHDEGARAIVIRANPSAGVWCAGYDLDELDPAAIARGGAEAPMFQVFERMYRSPVPVIAMVAGQVIGGGLLLVVHSDIVVANEDVTVRIPSAHHALPLPPSVFNWCVRTIGLHKTKELFFTGRAVGAEEARQAGLFNHVVRASRLEPLTYELAADIVRGSPEGVANARLQLNALASQCTIDEESLQAINLSNERLVRAANISRRSSG